MEILRNLNTIGPGDSDEALLDNWPAGLPAEGVYLDMDMPVNVGVAGTPLLSDLKNLLAYYLGVFTLAYGANKQHKPYIGVGGDKLRTAHRLMTMTEAWNDFVGIAQTTGAKMFHARILLTSNRQKSSARNRLIGPTQGRSIYIANREGAALTAGALTLTRGVGACVTRIVPVYRQGGDSFNHLPFYREVNRAALDLSGPDGKLLAFWDDNAPFATTTIGKYLLRIGEREYFRYVEPRYEASDYARDIDAGGSNVSDEVTLLYAADPIAGEEELPTGAPYLKLLTQDVANIKGRFLYLPEVPEGDAIAVVAEAAKARGEEVVGTVSTVPDRGVANGHVATAGIDLTGPSDAGFGTDSGLHADASGNVQTFVPPAVQAAVRGLPPGLAAKAGKVQSLRVPGATATSGRGRANGIRSYVRGVFGG